MGGTPYIEPRLGDGPIFEVSVSHLDAKERPGKLVTHAIFIIWIEAAATIDFSLIQARLPIESEVGRILRVSLTAAILSGRGYDR